MTVHLVTFATDDMSRSADLCELSARRSGVSDAWQWRWKELRSAPFFESNKELFSQPRGVGFWAWKPYVILNAISTGQRDYIAYADAGVEFINSVNYIIDRMDQDIFLFGNNWDHAHWCKRDTMEAVWPWWNRGRNLNTDADRIVNVFVGSDPQRREISTRELAWERLGKQAQASVIFFRVSDYTRAFVKEWLDWCLFEGGRLIDDSPSRLPNHPEFREHRHDQSILTTLAYREGLRLHYWPAIYNKDGSPEFIYEKLPEYAGDNYPSPLFHHHRRRNHEWEKVA